jgi:hypothetical protein
MLLIRLARSYDTTPCPFLGVIQIGPSLFNSEINILADAKRRFSVSLKIVVEITAIYSVDPPFQGADDACACNGFGSKVSGNDLAMFWVDVSLGRLLRCNSSRDQKQSERGSSQQQLRTDGVHPDIILRFTCVGALLLHTNGAN